MNHLGLFEGIGGFSLAARWMGWVTKGWCEIDPFCQMILKKHFKNAHGFNDIRSLNYATYKSVLRHRGDRDRAIDIITGGFPCQPYSTAGKRKGNDDDRALWPEMLRTICEFMPRFVVGENVAGILSMDNGRVLKGIITDLEAIGYSVQTFVIPACAVGAPHRRDRCWIIAHAKSFDDRRNAGTVSGKNGRQKRINIPEPVSANHLPGRSIGAPSNTNLVYRRAGARGRDGAKIGNGSSSFANPHGERFTKQLAPCQPGWQGFDSGRNDTQWTEHWLPVATRICRVDDGVSKGLDRIAGIQPEPPQKRKAAGRLHRLKALGNAIVPQVAFEIFKAIQVVEENNC